MAKKLYVGNLSYNAQEGDLTKANLIDRIFFPERILATYWKKSEEENRKDKK